MFFYVRSAFEATDLREGLAFWSESKIRFLLLCALVCAPCVFSPTMAPIFVRVSLFGGCLAFGLASCGKWSSKGSPPGSGRKSARTVVFGIQNREDFFGGHFLFFSSPGFLWLLSALSGCLCGSLAASGALWLLSGALWLPLWGSLLLAWGSLAAFGWLWLPLAGWALWLLLAGSGALWLPLGLSGCLWLLLGLFG